MKEDVNIDVRKINKIMRIIVKMHKKYTELLYASVSRGWRRYVMIKELNTAGIEFREKFNEILT